MTAIAQWQKENGAYLSASIEWLKLRLQKLAAETAQRDGADLRAMEAQVLAAAAAREQAAATAPPPSLDLLAVQLRLTRFEAEVVLLCAAMELDTRVAGLCAQAMGNRELTYPTFALALSLFEAPAWESISPQRPLRHWRLIEVHPGPAQPLTLAPLRLDERVLNYVKGLNALDPRLALHVRPVAPVAEGALPPSQAASVAAVRERWSLAPKGEPPPAAILLGPDIEAKLLVAAMLAGQLDRQLFRIGVDSFPASIEAIDDLARLWQRESALLPLALYVDAQTDSSGVDAGLALDRFATRVAHSNSPLLIGLREPLGRLSCNAASFDIARPTRAEQFAHWTSVLGDIPESERRQAASQLASQFSMNVSEISASAGATPRDPTESYANRVWDHCRDRSRPRLDTLAQRIDPKAEWSGFVVADETARLLRELTAQVRCRNTVYGEWGFGDRMNRGMGISALFAGESGTGKTMAAEVIANDLRLTLYRIDLSQVVSKYIGETEKNLQRVFDLMEGSGAILFFDEADALFGKRSEVRDSHDRYANIEVNYLLQRMENYGGVAILATNMRSALDQAFVRRLRFIIPFSFPGPAERRELWQRAFPAAVPREDLDFDRLSRLNLNGAGIHSVAVNAAFLAARDQARVSMPLILLAARTEFRKMERPMSETEFRA